MSLQAHDWGLSAEAVPGRAIPYPRGRVIGGSSAVNAGIALRGVPADYDEWAALGNDEWNWGKVLPHLRRLEDDPEGSDEFHGRGGPITICRWRGTNGFRRSGPSSMSAAASAFPRSRTTITPKRPASVTSRRTGAAACACPPRSPTSSRRATGRTSRSFHALSSPGFCSQTRRQSVSNWQMARSRSGSTGGGSPWRRARWAHRRSFFARVSGRARRCTNSASSRWWTCRLSEPASATPRSLACCSCRNEAVATSRRRLPRLFCATRPLARTSSTTCNKSFSATSTVAAIGGEQAVAPVGTPLTIGLPVALERPRARGRLSLSSSGPGVPPVIELNFAADPEDLRRLVEGIRLAWQIAREPSSRATLNVLPC